MVSMIPKEYQRVEYLETSGHDARINTGVSGNDTTLEIDCTFMPTKMGNSYTAIFGNYLDENDHYCWRCILQARTSSNYQTSFWVTMGAGTPGGNKSSTASARPVNNDDTILNKRIHLYESYGAYTISGTISNSYSGAAREAEINTTPIAIGAASIYSGGGGTNQFRIYSFWMKSQGQYVRNYIPCVRLSDSQAGFYDIINNTFNPSVGAKDFTPGPALPESSDILQYRRNILLNSPHLITTTSGNTSDSETIAHFKTDMAAPIKSLKVNFAPVQEGSGTPSPDNVRPISGWNSIDITRCGKNLLKYTTRPYSASGLTPVTTKNEDDEVVSIYWSGSTTSSNWFNNANYESVNKYSAFIGRFTLSTENNQMPLIIARNSSGGVRNDINMEDVPEYTIHFTSEQITENDTGTWYRLECWPRNTSEKVVDDYVYPMVRFPDDPAGFEPYKGQQISISLPDTFYGGYIDLITGELVETQGMEIFNGSEAWSSAGSDHGDRWRFNTPASNKYNITYGSSANGAIIADWAYAGANGANATANVPLPIITAGNYNPQFYMGIPLEWNITTVEDFKAYLAEHPLHVVTNLATPNRYQLSPQTLKTLRGINNIWSDAGSVEVQYWTH